MIPRDEMCSFLTGSEAEWVFANVDPEVAAAQIADGVNAMLDEDSRSFTTA
jgi:hypothetical protein